MERFKLRYPGTLNVKIWLKMMVECHGGRPAPLYLKVRIFAKALTGHTALKPF